jgi:hypothetical protein
MRGAGHRRARRTGFVRAGIPGCQAGATVASPVRAVYHPVRRPASAGSRWLSMRELPHKTEVLSTGSDPSSVDMSPNRRQVRANDVVRAATLDSRLIQRPRLCAPSRSPDAAQNHCDVAHLGNPLRSPAATGGTARSRGCRAGGRGGRITHKCGGLHGLRREITERAVRTAGCRRHSDRGAHRTPSRRRTGFSIAGCYFRGLGRNGVSPSRGWIRLGVE